MLERNLSSGCPVEGNHFRVNTILGNLKSTLRGIYHAVRPKYAQRFWLNSNIALIDE
jgi:hypothetical protein